MEGRENEKGEKGVFILAPFLLHEHVNDMDGQNDESDQAYRDIEDDVVLHAFTIILVFRAYTYSECKKAMHPCPILGVSSSGIAITILAYEQISFSASRRPTAILLRRTRFLDEAH